MDFWKLDRIKLEYQASLGLITAIIIGLLIGYIDIFTFSCLRSYSLGYQIQPHLTGMADNLTIIVLALHYWVTAYGTKILIDSKCLPFKLIASLIFIGFFVCLFFGLLTLHIPYNNENDLQKAFAMNAIYGQLSSFTLLCCLALLTMTLRQNNLNPPTVSIKRIMYIFLAGLISLFFGGGLYYIKLLTQTEVLLSIIPIHLILALFAIVIPSLTFLISFLELKSTSCPLIFKVLLGVVVGFFLLFSITV